LLGITVADSCRPRCFFRPDGLLVVPNESLRHLGGGPAVPPEEPNAELDDRIDLPCGGDHASVGRRRYTIESTVGGRRETYAGMRRPHFRVGQFDDGSVVEHEPRVTIAASLVEEPSQRSIVRRRVIVMQHHATPWHRERRLQN